ncbi:hypothetical protein BDP27DRAFT_1239674, partial [Rhodocollybia butyracea]
MSTLNNSNNSRSNRKPDWKRFTLTSIKENADRSNNFLEFKHKASIKLKAWKLWKYIGGDEYKPPVIPELVPSQRIQGRDNSGNIVDVTLQGNNAEVAIAERLHAEWLENDRLLLSLINEAVPYQKSYVLQKCHTSHDAWNALCREYEPNNSLIAMNFNQQISTFSCQPGADPAEWLQVMLELYGKLCAADSTLMSDSEFAKILITHMSKDEKWRYTRDYLRTQLQLAQQTGVPLTSSTVVSVLRSEHIDRGLAPEIKAMHTLIQSASISSG